MQGNRYIYDLDPQWASFLQALSDAVVFQGVPSTFPAYAWAGAACSLSLLS